MKIIGTKDEIDILNFYINPSGKCGIECCEEVPCRECMLYDMVKGTRGIYNSKIEIEITE